MKNSQNAFIEGIGNTPLIKLKAASEITGCNINGKAIASEHLRWKWHDDGRPPTCTMALSSPPFVYGDNYLGLRLTRAAHGAEGDIVVRQLECFVRA